MTRKKQKKETGMAAARPVEGLIHVIRGQKVMRDSDLAVLYEVTTSALNQTVRRNLERFPEDFMFQLTEEEVEGLRSQIVMSKRGERRGGRRYAPYVFTEHGVAMLASVLRSPRAIRTGLSIVRAFIRMREVLATHGELAARIERLEGNQERTVSVIEALVDDIDRLAAEVDQMRALPPDIGRRIGFVSAGD
jgi:hypothetical protein